ncbi:hypothetical protein V6N13_091668 [Hibiscus sabdariffa]|uniref:Uncharacterized protein n=1 Tax=Hibiscus sabdariffa TaxID=183260 RepID=A0ABR2QEJ0_9ROSI
MKKGIIRERQKEKKQECIGVNDVRREAEDGGRRYGVADVRMSEQVRSDEDRQGRQRVVRRRRGCTTVVRKSVRRLTVKGRRRLK